MKTNEPKQTRPSMLDVECWMLNVVLTLFLLSCTSAGAATVRYVDAGSTNATPPYTNWATAARVIQDAVDVSVSGDEVVVTNGLYATGGRTVGTNVLVNRVAVNKPLTVRSVHGPQFTFIQGAYAAGTNVGDGGIRCVYLTNGASLIGFTLTNGATRAVDSYPAYIRESCGGGLWSADAATVVSNCVFTGNAAFQDGGGAYQATLNQCIFTGNVADLGGGAAAATLNNCTLRGNTATFGGGAFFSTLNQCMVLANVGVEGGGGNDSSTLNNCLVISNTSYEGGGTWGSTLTNCTIAGNTATSAGGGTAYSTLWNCIAYYNTAATNGPNCWNPGSGGFTLNYCCTTPVPTNGVGHITNAPLFVSLVGGDFHLQAGSPGINAGTNAYAAGLTDLDGNPRIVDGTVDLGAYEFQASGPSAFQVWLQQYGLPTDGSADFTDPDADGRNNWQEWRCQTNPTNKLSVLRVVSALPAGGDVTVRWQSVAGVSYFLERSTNLASSPVFTPLATGIPGQSGTTSFTDTNAALAPRLFYRVGVP